VAALTKQIKRLAAELRVDLIHAHSPSLNGLAAAQAAKALGLPWVYELRYYEEDAAVDRGKTRHNSLRYRLAARLEQQALELADAVTTISQALREDLICRGIDPEKITVIPNGVDTDHFQPREADAEVINRYDLSGKTVIGFIGSFYFYEGLEFLVDATIELLSTRNDLALLLAGDGEALEMLQNRIPDGLRGHFILTGNVPHDKVRNYYSVMDILVYPRKRSRLTEQTTPLKPLEAMAMGKAVIGSDVGGLRELLGETGFLIAPEDAKALANLLLRLVENETERRAIAGKAREFVLQNRDWETIVRRYGGIYEKLLLT
jgi:glycogen(starch) synthase